MNPYIPSKLPLKTLDLTKLIPLIAKANIELGRYDGGLKPCLIQMFCYRQ